MDEHFLPAFDSSKENFQKEILPGKTSQLINSVSKDSVENNYNSKNTPDKSNVLSKETEELLLVSRKRMQKIKSKLGSKLPLKTENYENLIPHNLTTDKYQELKKTYIEKRNSKR